MAFSIKKKRMANPTQEQTENTEVEQPQAVDGIPNEVVFDGQSNKPNVVATQSWVCKTLKGFWNWTKFFATQTMQVAGKLHAQSVSTQELKTNDAYATKLTLIDPNGRPGVVYINEQGELKIDYDFQDVFVYPGNGDLDVKRFVYRTEDMAKNFYGLTPYETFLNFVPFDSFQHCEFNERICYKLCQADGADELIDNTLLFTCSHVKRIAAVKVLDDDGELVSTFLLPSDVNVRMLTVNMPSFAPSGSDESVKVKLFSGSSISHENFMPFVPPFLKPPFHPVPVPFFAPPKILHPSDDLFEDENPIKDDIFDETPPQPPTGEPEIPQQNYEVVYENYGTDTYYNIVLRRSNFTKNVKQYLVVETVDA